MRLIRLLAYLLCVSLAPFPLHAQWEHLPGPEGGTIWQFDTDGDVVYALSTGGIYRSADAGLTWNYLDRTLQVAPDIRQFQVEHGLLYILTRDGEVHRSPDNGATWTPVLQRPYPIAGPGENLHRLFVSGDTVLIGSTLSMYSSFDRGDTWQASEIFYKESFGLIVRVSNDFYALMDRLIRKSSDGGLSWKTVYASSFPINDMAVMDTVLYALYQSFPRMIRTEDGGASWKKIDPPGEWTYGHLVAHGGRLIIFKDFYCENKVRLYTSSDRGGTWTELFPQGLKFDLAWCQIAVPGAFLLGTPNGIIRSANHGKTFSTAQAGINSADVRQLFNASGQRWWAQTFDGVFFSDDDGASWTMRFSQQPCDWHFGVLSHTQKRIFYDDGSGESIVQVSEDNGNSWAAVPLGHGYNGTPLKTTDQAAWGLLQGQLYRWADDEPVARPFPFPHPDPLSRLYALNNVIAVESDDHAWVSMNEGDTWQAIAPLPMWCNFMGMDKEALFCRQEYGDTLFMLNVHENVWRQYTPVNALTGDTIAAGDILFFQTEGDLRWMGVSGRGLFYANIHDPQNWYPYLPMPGPVGPSVLAFAGEKLWMGTKGTGIFRTSLSFKTPETPEARLTLFPNPSSGVAVQLSSDQFFTDGLSVRIWDTAGRLVRELALSPGQSWTLYPGNIPAGVYVLQIRETGQALKWVKGF